MTAQIIKQDRNYIFFPRSVLLPFSGAFRGWNRLECNIECNEKSELPERGHDGNSVELEHGNKAWSTNLFEILNLVAESARKL